MSIAPGAYVTVTAAPPSPNTGDPTGAWFVTGPTVAGPVGVAVPVASLTDFVNFFGPRVSYSTLYDALDEYFHDGGVQAYVSRVFGPSAATAQAVIPDRTTPTPQNTLIIKACGPGAWANQNSSVLGLTVVVANGSVSNSYTITVYGGGTTTGTPIVTSPNLFTPADAVTWFGAQNSWQTQVVVVNQGALTGGVVTSTNNPAPGTYTLGGGSDDVTGIVEATWTNALTAFNATFGPGQVSAPGHTTTAGYGALANHALAYGRVALLDAADSPALNTTLITQAQAAQGASTDASYSAIFAPWIILPGLTSVNPAANSPVPNRVCPPSALAAALMSKNDIANDSNRAAAGPNGQSKFAIGVTQNYPATTNVATNTTGRGDLNAAGVNIILQLNGVTTLYGFRSLSLDPNWTSLSSVRMRMQMVYEFDNIANGFVFGEIDGKGQLFAQLNGALAGKCQQYWINNSLYGLNPQDSYAVNTGPQVNTPASIAAGQINAQVLVRLSPTAEVVQINVVKYLSSATLPTV